MSRITAIGAGHSVRIMVRQAPPKAVAFIGCVLAPPACASPHYLSPAHRASALTTPLEPPRRALYDPKRPWKLPESRQNERRRRQTRTTPAIGARFRTSMHG